MERSFKQCGVFFISFLLTTSALANPQGGRVTAGDVTISNPNQQTVHIQQNSNKAVVEWKSFNIHSAEHTHFQQPKGGVILNRIDAAQGASQIYGKLTATGKIILINRAGIIFGPGSYVSVGSIIASTANMSDENFLQGKYIFDHDGLSQRGSIINQGEIHVAEYGLAALLGDTVINEGKIEARLGQVVLASGSSFTLDFIGDGMINFAITKAAENTTKHAVSNTGSIIADGGRVVMAANSASTVLDHLINMEGVAQVRSVENKNGEIILNGESEGVVHVSGKLDASGREADQTGGKVHIAGKNIEVLAPAQIDVSGHLGGGEILIGGDYQGQGDFPHAETVYIARGAMLSADAIAAGNGGKIVAWSDHATFAYGNFSARGGAQFGNGGDVETSGHYLDINGIGGVDLRAPNGSIGTWLLDPANVSIDDNTTQNINFSGGQYTPALLAVLGVTLNAGDLGTQLNSANVKVVTTNALGLGNGDITFNDPANLLQTNWANASTTLTLQADRHIIFNSDLTLNSTGKTLTLSAGTTAASGSVTLNNTMNGSFNLTITTGASGTVTLGAALGGTTALTSITVTGSSGINLNTNTVTTTGAQTYNNAVTLGTSSTVTGGQISFQGVSLGANTLAINTSSASSAVSGVISGSGGLTKSGNGTLTLSGVNTYSGTTTINAGTLKINADSGLGAVPGSPTAGKITFAGGVLETTATFTLNANRGIALNSGGGTLLVDPATTLTYNGIIAGTGSLTKEGTGTLILGGANTYTGNTIINNGTLQLGAAGVIADSSAVTLANTAGAILNLNNFNETIGTLSGGGTTGGNISLGSGTLTITQVSDAIYAGVISGSGGIIKAGANALTLSGVNVYTGVTSITVGMLVLGAAGVIADASAVVLANVATAILNLNGFNEVIGSLSGGGATGGNISLGGGTLTVTQTSDATYAGVISGSGGLTKAGANTLTLSGANTYTGTTTINAGTLRLGAAGVIADSSAVTLANVASAVLDLNNFNETIGTLSGGGATGGNISLGSGTLTVTQTSDAAYAGVISGSGGLTKAGANTLTLSGANTYTGTTTINAGTLRLGAAGVIADTSAVTLANVASAVLDLNNFNETIGTLSGGGATGGNISLGSGTLTVTQTSDAAYAGIISGSGGLTKAGANTLTLSGANTYTGTTTINAGTLRLGAAGVIADASAVTLANVASAVLDLNNFNETIGALSGGGATGGNISLGSGTLTVTQTGDATYAGIISGSGGLTKAGANTLTLSGANTYTGTTTINAGTLRLGAADVIADSSAVALANTAGAIFDLNNFNETIGMLSGGGATGGNISLGSGTLTVTQTGDATYAGVISGSGGLTKAGANILTLSGANTYTGTTTINAGTLRLGAAGVIADSSAVALANTAGAIFDLNNFNETIGTLSGGGATGGNILLGSGTLTVTQTSDAAYAGVISGSGGLTKAGANTLTLSGANTYTGSTTINAGTLQLGAAGVIADSSAVTLANVASALLDLNNFNETIGTLSGGGATGGNISLGSGTLTVTQTSDAAYAGIISGSGGITKAGANTLTLSGANTYTGTTTINAGTLRLGASGVIADSSAVTLANTSGAIFDLNNFNETIGTLSGGGATGGNISLGSGTLTVTQTSDATYAGIISGSGGLTKAGANTLTLSGANTYTGTTTINAGTLRLGAAGVIADASAVTLANVASAVLDLNNFNETIGTLSGGGATGGNISLGSGTLTVTQTGDATYAGIISGSGGLTKAGANTLTLSGANTYTGSTTINAGTLQLGAAGVIADTSAVTLANVASATLDLNNFNETIGTLSGGGATGGNISLGSGTLTVTQSNDANYTGIISGSGGLTKAGANALTLSGANTYTGTTTINAGTLRLGAVGVIADSSAVTLANVASATLDLNNFNETIGTLSGGGATGGNISLGSGTLTVTQSNDATYAGIISGSGGLTKAGTNTLTLSGANTYTGTTMINAGTLRLGAADVIADSSAVTLANTAGAIFDLNNFNETIGTLSGGGATGGNISLGSGTLTVTQSNDATYAGIISGSGGITKAGANTLTLSGANTYTGTATINAGTLQLGASGVIADTSAVTLANVASATFDLNNFNETIGTLSGGGTTGGNISLGSGTLTVTQSNDATYAGIISGSGGITKAGANILTLSGANTYTGTTTINAGTLQLGAAGVIADSSAVTLANVASATLDLNNFNETIGTLSGGGATGGNIALGSGTLTVTQTSDAAYAGVISGSGNIIKSGAGALTLSGINTYGGSTTIASGTLSISADSGLGAAPGAPALNKLIFNGGTLQTTNTFTLNANRGVSLNASGTFLVDTGTTLTYNGIIAGANDLTKQGDGTLMLGGANAYTGTTTINAGTLRLGAAGVIADSSAVTLANVAGVTFDLNNFNETIGTLSGGGAIGGNISLGSGTLTVTQTSDAAYAGIISGSGGITKAGANTLTLSGANTYTGTTTINAGTLRLGAAGVIADSSAVTLANTAGAILNLNGFNETIGTLSGGGATGGNISLGSGTLTVTQTSDATYAGIISGSGGLTKAGANTLTLSGANTYTDTTTINAGTLQLGASGVIADSSAVTLANVASALLDLNNFNETIGTLSGGGATGGNISLGSGTLTVTQTSDATYAGIISGTGGLTKAGANTLTLSGANTYTGTTTINAGTLRLGASGVIADSSAVTLANVASAVLDLNNFNETIGTLSGGGTTGGNIALGSGTLTVTQSNDATYAGIISGTGGLTKAGANTLTLSGANTYTGVTTINAGTLRLGASGVIADTSAVTLADVASAVLDLNNFSETIGTLSGGGATGGNIALGSGTLTVTQTSDATYAGIVSGSGGLTKAGANILTLSGANTYTGTTTINAGTLQLGAAGVIADTSAVTLANVASAILDLNNFNETIGTLSGGGATGGNISLGSGTLTVTQSNDATYTGIISGTGGLTKEGANTLTLSGANTYTGSTTINAGTLQLGAAGVIADSSAVTLANVASALLDLNNFNETIGTLSGGGATGGNISLGSGTLTVTQTSDATYAGIISGSGGLTKAGANTLTLSGANTYTGTTTINAGTLQLGAAGVIADTSAVTLANVASATLDLNNFNETIGTLSGGGATGGNVLLGSGTLTVTQTSDATYAGVISGSGGLTKAGANVLTLSGANTYTGTTTINAGTLRLGAAGVIADTSAVALANTAGAIFDLNNFNETIGTLSGGGTTGGNISLGSGTLTVTQSNDATYAGVISGSGGITKAGANTLTLSGANTYTGATTINAGTLQLGASGVIANTSAVTLANTAGAIFDLNNFNETVGGLSGGGATGGNITLGSGTLTVTQTSDAVYAGIISGSGGLTKAGTNTLTLSGENTYTGTTTINAGTLRLGAAGVIADTSAVTLANVASATFDLNNFNETIGTLSGGGTTGGNISLGSGTLTVTQTSAATYAGVISGSGGLIKAGTNTLTLTGANTYTGATTINAGTLRLGAAGVIADTSAVTLANVASATFDLNNFNETIGTLSGGGATGGNISLGNGTLTVTQTSDAAYAGIISGSGGLTKVGANTLTLSGANTYTGTTTINAGTLQLGAADVIADTSAVTLANVASATLDLNNFNETIGTLSGGGATGGNISLGSGTLTVTQTSDAAYAGVISGSGNIVKSGAGTLMLSGVNTYGGSTTIASGTLSISADSGLGAAPGAPALNKLIFNGGTLQTTNTFTLNANRGVSLNASGTFLVDTGTTLTYNGIIAGANDLTKQGDGTLILGGANTYTGTTTINAGTLRLGASGVIADSSAVTLANVAGVTFDLNNFNETIGALSGGGAIGGNISLGSGTLTVTQTSDAAYAGIISGTGGLTKAGANTLTLSGANTYTGTTTINAGTLRLGAAGVIADSSAVTLANTAGAILNLNGFNETIGTLSGGGATGGNISLGSGTLTVTQTSDATYAGIISGSGGLTKAGANTLTLSGANTYTGTTTINAGTLQLGASDVIADTSAVTLANVASATLDLDNFNETLGTLSGGGTTGGNIALGSGTLTVTQMNDATYAGVINGSGNIIKQGSETLTMTGVNTYTGTTTINSGILSINADSGIGAGNLILGGGTLQTTNTFSLNPVRDVILNTGGGTFLVNAGTTLTYLGSISGGNTFTKQGSGTLILGGANTYTGATSIQAGMLTLAAANVISDSSAISLSNTTGVALNLNNFNQTINTLSGGGTAGGNINLGAATLTIVQNNNASYGGVISGSGGITKEGNSTLTLAGNNTYLGMTTINAGILSAAHVNALGSTSSGTTVATGATLNIQNVSIGKERLTLSGTGVNGDGALVGTGITFYAGNVEILGIVNIGVPGAGIMTLTGNITGRNGIVKVGTGTLILPPLTPPSPVPDPGQNNISTVADVITGATNNSTIMRTVVKGILWVNNVALQNQGRGLLTFDHSVSASPVETPPQIIPSLATLLSNTKANNAIKENVEENAADKNMLAPENILLLFLIALYSILKYKRKVKQEKGHFRFKVVFKNRQFASTFGAINLWDSFDITAAINSLMSVNLDKLMLVFDNDPTTSTTFDFKRLDCATMNSVSMQPKLMSHAANTYFYHFDYAPSSPQYAKPLSAYEFWGDNVAKVDLNVLID